MIYITKEGIPNELNGKIIKIQKSTRWKNIDEYDTNAIRQVFDNEFPKNEMKKILISEQKGLCAYCMRRIHVNSHSRIEHYIPLSRNKEKAIDYTNLLGVCDGGESIEGKLGHSLCCDANKKEEMITINPLNEKHMELIAYKPDGTIYTKPKDDALEKDINETLMLNGTRNKDGSVLDTATELLKGRRDAYERASRIMKRLNREGKCTSLSISRIIDNLSSQAELDEYVGVMLYYLKKKYISLIRRGL